MPAMLKDKDRDPTPKGKTDAEMLEMSATAGQSMYAMIRFALQSPDCKLSADTREGMEKACELHLAFTKEVLRNL